MKPPIDVEKIVELAEKAAALLAGQPAEISLRTPEAGKLWWSELQIIELSQFAKQRAAASRGDHVHDSRTIYLSEKPYLIYSVQWTRGAVTIRAQGSRDIVADDIRKDAHYRWDGKDRSFSEALTRLWELGSTGNTGLLKNYPAGPFGYCGFIDVGCDTGHEHECTLPAIGTSADDVPACAKHFEGLVQEGLAGAAFDPWLKSKTCASCGVNLEDSDPGKLCRACRD